MISAAAGTFNILHEGHKRLIDTAFEVGDHVIIGITADNMAAEGRSEVIPLYIRRSELERYLLSKDKPWEILEIDDIFGPPEKMDRVDVLVVSDETYSNGLQLNRDRADRGVGPLEICVIPTVTAHNGKKLSSSAILSGEYSRNGSESVPRIAVGSRNHVKVMAVRNVMEKIFGDIIVTAVEVDSGVPPQPMEGETRKGAVTRAERALGDHDLSVGIEAGVFRMEDGLYDFQYCAVVDREGRVTVGTGSGFRYPDSIADAVMSGMTVGEAVKKVYGYTDIGRRQGAIGLLSKGLIDRRALTEQSVIAAMIPRIWDEPGEDDKTGS